MSHTMEIKVPDIGDFADVPVIDVLVKPGDRVEFDAPLITLESDKATMDIPSPAAGVIESLSVKVGDRVSEGRVVAVLQSLTDTAPSAASVAPAAAVPNPVSPPAVAPAPPSASTVMVATEPSEGSQNEAPAPTDLPLPSAASIAAELVGGRRPHASPSIRRFARELGADLNRVTPSGPKGRITRDDVAAWVKHTLAGAGAPPVGGGGALPQGPFELPAWPKVDFSKFGPISTETLPRIRKLSAANLARNWIMIPAVTYHEDADITDLEAFRVQYNKENEKSGAKVTLLAFLIKACVAALKKFPEFNSSLDTRDGEPCLVLKQYYHIGFAADTPNGLVVPVIRNADAKSISEIARETGTLAAKAREGKLGPADMQGASFTLSSLGGIGGTSFSPIVNAPEVAILGVNKSTMKPVWDGNGFVPRLILPLSLSADHRVIDGASATRFNAYVASLLADMRRSLM